MKTITPGTEEFKAAMKKCQNHRVEMVGSVRQGYEYRCYRCNIRWERRPDMRSQ